MKKIVIMLCAVMTAVTACSRNVKVSPDVKKVALVQCAVSQPMRVLTVMGKADATPVIRRQLSVLLAETEAALRKHWTVIPASSFVAKPQVQALSRFDSSEDIISATIMGRNLPILSDWKVGSIPADTVKKLCALTGADAVVLTVSSWEVQTMGAFAPAQYPHTYMSFAMYDRNGDRLFYETASETYGGMHGYWDMKINDTTIRIWKNISIKLTKEILNKYAP